MRSQIFVVLMLLLTLATAGAAQGPTRPVAVGDTVRVTLTDGWRISGILTEVSPGAMSVEGDDAVNSMRSLPVSAVSRIELLDGRRPAIVSGMKVGALVGGFLGLMALGGGSSSGGGIVIDMRLPPIVALAGVGTGLVVGALMGAGVRGKRWVSAQLPPS
jgi:hypothetical protein